MSLRGTLFRRCMFVLGFHIATTLAASAQILGGQPSIDWWVENRFRFYKDPEIFKQYAQVAAEAFRDSSAKDGWILETERRLQKLYTEKRAALFPSSKYHKNEKDIYPGWNGWASLTRDSTCWERSTKDIDGHCEDYILPVSHNVMLKLPEPQPDRSCIWEMDVVGVEFVADRGLWHRTPYNENKKIIGTPVPCSATVKLAIPWSVATDANGQAKTYGLVKVFQINGTERQQIASERITVTDLLVLGMGDSFGAGVGNPDKPARLDPGVAIQHCDPLSAIGKRIPLRSGGYEPGDGCTNGNLLPSSIVSEAQAEWLDIRCFRSQYGPQFRAALHMAIFPKHVAVTYIDLACDGARIIEGLLHQKKLGKGISTPFTPSQIEFASNLLCNKNSQKAASLSYKLRFVENGQTCSKSDEICEYGRIGNNRELQNIRGLPKTDIRVCPANRFVRSIDILLLSIGGNDIGFAPMLGDVIIEDERIVEHLYEKLGPNFGMTHSADVGLQRLGLLRTKYERLNDAFKKALPIKGAPDRAPIFLAAYPLQIADEDGSLCGSSLKNIAPANAAFNIDRFFVDFSKSSNNRPPPLDRLKSVRKTACLLNLRRFSWFSGTSGNSSELTKPGGICEGITDHANSSHIPLPWQYVSEAILPNVKHGFCASASNNSANQLAVPEFRSSGTVGPYWNPKLETLAPYRSRTRWVRTANDAYVITNWLTQYGLNDFFNMVSAATTSVMHPTAEGYASMADATLLRVNAYLCDKHNGDLRNESYCAKNLSIMAAQ